MRAERYSFMTFHSLSSKLEVVVGLSKVQKSKSETRPQPIAVLIGQLESGGGSERQLYMFLAHCDRTRWAPVVYVSGVLGIWEAPIRKLGIPVVLLCGNSRGSDSGHAVAPASTVSTVPVTLCALSPSR